MYKNKNNLYILTKDFYDDHKNLKEIMQKKDRPYYMYNLVVDNIEFAIPLRSDIKHTYYFYSGITEKGEICGIDYTKAVILTDKNKYVKNEIAWIRENEYRQIRGKEYLIAKEFKKYIKIYKKAYKIISQGKGSKQEEQLCIFSTLQNYHRELNID